MALSLPLRTGRYPEWVGWSILRRCSLAMPCMPSFCTASELHDNNTTKKTSTVNTKHLILCRRFFMLTGRCTRPGLSTQQKPHLLYLPLSQERVPSGCSPGPPLGSFRSRVVTSYSLIVASRGLLTELSSRHGGEQRCNISASLLRSDKQSRDVTSCICGTAPGSTPGDLAGPC